MKYLIISSLLLLSQSVFSQINIGETYMINKIVGQNIEDTQAFKLTKIKQAEIDYYVYGSSIVFNEDNTFGCHYSAPCGNDCFPSSVGTFELQDDGHIKLFVKEFNQSGYCEEKHIVLNSDLGIYNISNESDKVILITKSDEE